MDRTQYSIPVVDSKEEHSLSLLTARYNKLMSPTILSKVGSKATKFVPKKVKRSLAEMGSKLSEQEILRQMMKLVETGFSVLENEAAKYTISEKQILKRLSKTSGTRVESLRDVCFLRSYDIEKALNGNRSGNLVAALTEGGVTGAFGFAGLPFNLVLSLFLYFRCVQAVAMFYGYDVKRNNQELAMAGEVFMAALNPGKGDTDSEATTAISKLMAMSEATIVREASKKSWKEMASQGGVALLLTQIRALTNRFAREALEKAGEKQLEKSIFSRALRLLSRKLTLKSISKAVPVVSAVLGGLMDTAQMNKVLEYAEVYYGKRFIIEKAERQDLILHPHEVVDAEYQDC